MTAAPTMIRTILFDLGSTLWDHANPETFLREESAADKRTGATLRELLAPDLSTWDDFTRGQAYRERFFQALQTAYAKDPLLEPDFASLSLDVAQSMGYNPVEQAWGTVLYEAMRVRSMHARVVFPDVFSTLEALQSRGYSLGVVTNRAYGGPVFLDDLREMGLLRFFDPRHIAVSADLGYRKPHSAIFLHALEGLGRASHESAMVGDRMDADVVGATKLGMFTVWRPRRDETEEPGQIAPAAVITEISDLLEYFP